MEQHLIDKVEKLKENERSRKENRNFKRTYKKG